MKKSVAISIFSIILALATAIISVGFGWSAVGYYVENYFGWGAVEQKEDGTVTYYSPKYATEREANSVSREVAIKAQAEGTVLLENNGALPLEKSERNISVFGTGSINIAYGGTGSGEGNGGKANVDLYIALKDAGFSYNPELKKFYEKKYKAGYHRGNGTDMNGAYKGIKGARSYGYSINEVERTAYSSIQSSYEEYDDAAIIVISRSGGEGQDLPTSMLDFYEKDDKHYLELTDEEIELLKEVKEGGFGKIIVLLNTLNVFETGFLKDKQYGIDAALWIGGTGQYGLEAVAKILTGELTPEGRLPDTYAYDLLSAPAMVNYGDNRYTENGKKTTAAYVAYEEGIYVGYRYYETRYADFMSDNGNAGNFNYQEQVVYPFGYGLSYTDFIWSQPTMSVDGDKITVSVTVTNIGTTKGKEVVELYLNKPYTRHDAQIGVEESAVELVGYAKTKTLSPNEHVEVSITVDKKQLSSYDAYEKKTYRMDSV
ncbi:MAG: glycoside hydrolase family 3 C-terminal domain-containing protein [Clostridia bacterium]|nr:glycoside hydrolase family 3 C-terminal domain-containing protein [Clostridia bacterium]